MRLGQAVVRSILQQNLTLAISFVTAIVISRLLTPAEFGSYAIALALLNIAATLRDFGISSYVVSAPTLDDGLMDPAFGLALASAALLAAGLWGASWPIAGLYGDPVLGEVLRIATFQPLLAMLVFPSTVLLTRELRFDALLVAGITGALVQGAVSIGLAVAGFGAVGLGWGFVAGAATTSLVTLWYRPDGGRVRPAARGWGRLVRFGGLMTATLALGTAAQSMPQLVVGRLAGIADAGLFARAQNLVSVVLNGLFFAVARTMLPGLAQAERTAGTMVPIWLRVVEAVTGIAWPAYVVLVVWGEPLVGLVYGEVWRAAGALLLPIAIAHGATLAVTPHYDLLIVKRRVGLLFVSELAVLVVGTAALTLGLMAAGGLAAGLWGMAAGGLFFTVWYFVTLRRLIDFPVADLVRAWGRSLVLALAALPFPLALSWLEPQAPLAVAGLFLLSGALAGLAWLAAMRLVGHELGAHVFPLLASALAGLRRRPVASP